LLSLWGTRAAREKRISRHLLHPASARAKPKIDAFEVRLDVERRGAIKHVGVVDVQVGTGLAHVRVRSRLAHGAP
jgi:hypothetical protein